MKIEITVANISEKQIIKNLYAFFRYDLMPFVPDGPGSDVNRYGVINGSESQTHAEAVQDCDVWWEKPGVLRPFLVETDGKPIGFAMVASPPHAHPDVDYRLNEFFILNKYRRHGIGRTAAGRLFDRLPGKWELAWAKQNRPAAIFWRKVVPEYTRGCFQERVMDQRPEEEDLPGYRFESPTAKVCRTNGCT